MPSLPPNRHPLNCTYSRDHVVAALSNYYLTLTKTAYIPVNYVDFPPPGGWSDAELDVGALRALRRSETVIDLLRHLPYARPMHDGPRPGPWNVAPQAKAVRYLRHMGDFSHWSDRGDAGLLELAALPMGQTPAGPMDLPPDVVALTHGERGPQASSSSSSSSSPVWWIVDCTRGIISPFQERVYGVSHVPRNKPWRTVQSFPVADYFSNILASMGSGWIPLPPTEDLDAEIVTPSHARSAELSQVYHSFGWPGDTFRHDECIVALQNIRRQMQEQERLRIAQDVDDADDEDFEMGDSDDDMEHDEGEPSLADAVADMDMDDLTAEAAALRADMTPEERARFDKRQAENNVPFEWTADE